MPNLRRQSRRALFTAVGLAAFVLLAILAGTLLLDGRLRARERQRASNDARQLVFGVARDAEERFDRAREEFVYSLTTLPYEVLLRPEDPPTAALVPLRRFLSLNPHIFKSLVVVGQDGGTRMLSRNADDRFELSPLSQDGMPDVGKRQLLLTGVIQSPDGTIRARVGAVVDPLSFWREVATTFALSHPDSWIHLVDETGRPLLCRNGTSAPSGPTEFAPLDIARLGEDAREGFEGRLVHVISVGDRRVRLISAYAPVRVDEWRGLLMISSDEHVVLGAAGDALALLATLTGLLVLLFLGIFAFFIRNLVRNQRLLEDGNRRIAAVLDTVQSGILLVHSRTGLVTEVNAAAVALLGRPADDILGRPVDSFLPPAAGAETSIVMPNGGVRHVLATNGRLVVAGNHYRLHSFVDITPLKLTESRLQETLRRAEESAREAAAANAAKSAFLAMMSHELRTPLNSILGLSESLLERLHGTLTDTQDRYLSMVVKSGRHLLSLINDILDLAKIESGREDLELLPCALKPVCQAAAEVVQSVVARRRQSLLVELPDDPVFVEGDARRLQQILVNLLGNAAKFTPEGGELGLRVTADDQCVHLRVWDRGIGIAEADRERIFKPFVQLDARLSREYGGTGLGLALVKQLVAHHGGVVEVESEPGRGSAFTVTLPRAHPPAPASPAPAAAAVPLSAAAGAELLVLLVEDTDFNVVPVRDFLVAMRCRVEVAENGAVALEKVVALRPDVVLMDVQMPVMDGIEATRCIRALPDPALARTPIIAVTALAMPGDREQCMRAGTDHYLSKPYSLAELHRLILDVVASRRT